MVQLEQPNNQTPETAAPQPQASTAVSAATEPDWSQLAMPPRTDIKFFTAPITDSPIISAASNLGYAGIKDDDRIYVSQMSAWQISGASARSQTRDINPSGICDGQVFTAANSASSLPVITGPEESLRKLTQVSIDDAILLDLTNPGSVQRFSEAFRREVILSLRDESDPMIRLQRMQVPQRGEMTPENLKETVNGSTDLVADTIRNQGGHGCIVALPQPSGEYHLGVIVFDRSKVTVSDSMPAREDRGQSGVSHVKITAA